MRNNFIRVFCADGKMPLYSANCYLIDVFGNTVSEGVTDVYGYAFLPFIKGGFCRVVVKSESVFAPMLQQTYLCLQRNRFYCVSFDFFPVRRPTPTGAVSIELSDAYYPLRKLEKGGFDLWLMLK